MNNFRQLSYISVSSFWSGGLKCRRTKDISNFMSEFYVPCLQGLPV